MNKGDIIKFGKYPQGADGSVLPIEWIVLDVNKNEALLISRYCLDYNKYHDLWWDITWEDCDLRKWLNTNFVESAFSNEEKKIIKISELKNDDNPKCGTRGGNDTKDRVFCLSIAEAEQYFDSDNNRECISTAYAYQQGKELFESICPPYTKCIWLLRSPGMLQRNVATVERNGKIDLNGLSIGIIGYPVRPALRIVPFSKEENKEQKLVDVVRKTHNLQCGIFGNISDDLGDLPFSELSPMVRMAYAYARRFVAAGLYVQGVFSYDQYMYICTVFMSFQITTAKDANLLPGEDVSFQEDALRQAVELLITYDNRFNIS